MQSEVSEPVAEEVTAILPVCPHCGDDPAKLSTMSQLFPGGAIASICFCGNPVCRKIIAVQLVGMAKQDGPQLVKPAETV